MIEDYDGSCTIIWPRPQDGLAPLMTWPMKILDSRTGKEMLGITGISIHLGGREWHNTAITAQITALADEDGSILPTDRPLPVVWENPEAPEDQRRVKLGEYLYLVTEMRVAE